MEERIIKDINNLLTQLFQKMREAGYKWDAEHKQLKKIEQNPAWSEEDENYICNIIGALEILIIRETERAFDGDRNAHPKYYKKLQEWLKSLRPQSQWKPTDNQMKALNAINVTGGLSYVGQAQELIALYNDLKKLREKQL